MAAPRSLSLRALHRATQVAEALRTPVTRVLRRRGWSPEVLPYTGYGLAAADGHDGWVRLLGRVLLSGPEGLRPPRTGMRGWRHFLSAPVAGAEVRVRLAGQETVVTSGYGGYVDVVLPAALPAGSHRATLSVNGTTAEASLLVVDPTTPVGVVSDIDDTVLVTAMPRPLLAFWNTFVLPASARRPVTGMAQLYQEVLARRPGTLVVYLSTGAWNVAPALTAFLARHGFPPGPLLMTDWGPTPDSWFRSGRAHKRTQLRRLMTEFPQMRWLLVGDDGQHDPELYHEAAKETPHQVLAIAIRELTTTEQVRTHGVPVPLPDWSFAPQSTVPEIRAADGSGLGTALRTRSIVLGDGPNDPSPS